MIGWIAWGNTALELNEHQIKSEDLPEAFDGFRIAQVSDLHNAEMGEKNSKLLELLEEAKPDIIVMTGDMIDSRNTDIEIVMQLAKHAVEIAPCYYVTGNHESRVSKEVYQDFEEKMKVYGVQVLHNEAVIIERDGEHIVLAGLDDSTFAFNHNSIRYSNLANVIQELFPEEGFQILLSHRPELFETYVKAEVDFVFSGHAHGGQVRLPFVGGLAAPHQGFLPKYDEGLFSEDGTDMIVSRGIGNSIFPVRFNNRPEVVVVELSK
jgi:predicted MPP superfamily phosphohydrolase